MSKIITSNIPLVQQVVQACKSADVRHIIISPGSRNAPLAISFANDPFFTCYSIVDERCAAFFALGIAQQLQKPAALVCTSGSAILNYYPAVAEAFYSDIALVVLSADRPVERIDIGDGQTIRQEHVLANHVEIEGNLKNAVTYTEALENENEDILKKVLKSAVVLKGPVHLNIPLYEPLYNTLNKSIKTFEKYKFNVDKTNLIVPEAFIKSWQHSRRKMVLVGVMAPNSIASEVLDRLMADPTVVLFTETTSNIYHKKAIPSIDQVISNLSEDEFLALQPEVLLTFGGMIISKRIKASLRKFQPKAHYHVDEKKAYDTYGCLTTHFRIDPQFFLEQLPQFSSAEAQNSYQEYWLSIYEQKLANHHAYLKKAPYCDLKVFEQIFDLLPANSHLQLSNSSTIRYAQLFRFSKKTVIFSNRGTSGIDGSTSTAIGAAMINNKNPVFITGDLSFLYDSNALWNKYIPGNFKIIIINNSGGGIFRILPGDKNADYFSDFLETNHSYTAKHLAKMYGFNYTNASNLTEVQESLVGFYKSTSKEILEIFTPRKVNDQVLLSYFS